MNEEPSSVVLWLELMIRQTTSRIPRIFLDIRGAHNTESTVRLPAASFRLLYRPGCSAGVALYPSQTLTCLFWSALELDRPQHSWLVYPQYTFVTLNRLELWSLHESVILWNNTCYIVNNCQPVSVSWCQACFWSPLSDFCFLSDSCEFLNVGRPLWREDGSVIYSYKCFWALPRPKSHNSCPYISVSSETPPTCRARSPYLYPPETG
jgi:hypothetical protein